VEIPFRHYIMGDWVRHSGWGPTPLPRFFRRGAVHFRDTVHGYIWKDNKARATRLDPSPGNCIHHFNYVDSSQFVEKMNRYTDIEAQQLYAHNVPFSCGRLLKASVFTFFGRFVKERGYRDGVRGFFLCLMMAFYQALSHIKLWEKRTFGDDPVPDRYGRIRQELLHGWKNNAP
jgi:hypothetical protein